MHVTSVYTDISARSQGDVLVLKHGDRRVLIAVPTTFQVSAGRLEVTVYELKQLRRI